MTPVLPYILDLAVVAILIFFFARGRKKGLVLTLCGLAAFFVAIFGARVLSQQLSPLAADALTPHFTSAVEQYMGDSLPEQVDQLLDADGENGNVLTDILKAVGVYDTFANSVRELLDQQLTQTVSGVAGALAYAIAKAVSGVLIFILGFLLIYVLWSLFSKALNLATRLPVIKTFNGLLGGLVGLGEGILLLFLIAWLLRLFGGIIPPEVAQSSFVARFFFAANPVSTISGF